LRPSRLPTACSLLLFLIAGCSGGDDDARIPAAPLPGALAYARSDSGAVFVVDTDVKRAIARLDGARLRRAGGRALEGTVAGELAARGIDFERSIRPQLGNPLVVAITHGGERVGAIRLRDPERLRREVKPGRHGSAFVALNGRELVVAQSQKALDEALEAAKGSDNLAGSPSFRSLLGRLPRSALVRGLGDAQRLLRAGDPLRAADARRVPWIRALGAFELVAEAKRRKIDVDFRLATTRSPLTADDLPLATGPASPRLHDPAAPAAVAVRDPRQLVGFLEETLRATDPARFERYQAGREGLRSILGVDLRADLLDRIESLSIAASSPTALTFQATLEPGSASDFARDLDRATPFVEGLVNDSLVGTRIESRGTGESRVWLVRNRGVTIARYAVRGDTLVGAVGLSELPDPTRGVRLRGVRGSLVLKGDVDRIGGLARLVLEVPRRTFGIVSSLGELSLGVRTSTEAMTGNGQIAVGAGRRR
jgi:hypothetical protein